MNSDIDVISLNHKFSSLWGGGGGLQALHSLRSWLKNQNVIFYSEVDVGDGISIQKLIIEISIETSNFKKFFRN